MSAGERQGHMMEPHRKLLHFVEPTLSTDRYRAFGRSPAFMLSAPSGRRRADESCENPRQMALIGKPANDGDLRGRNRRFQQQRFCLLDSA